MPTALTSRSAEKAEHISSCAIQVENLGHRYNGREALRGISLAVQPAEIFGLLGPNGSGKTTLFRILSTLMLPTSGRALICGTDVAHEPHTVRQHIGVVFQAQSIDAKLTAAENLWHQGHLYGLHGGSLQRRVQEMLSHVGLAERANDRVETFSGGMQRRVELAKGLMHRPAVLLLDEPTTGLDPGARIDLWRYLKALRDEEHVSVLITTHLMEEAERCDRLAILSEGQLVALGTPGELKSAIGGDVIVIESPKAESMVGRIKSRFGVLPALVDGKLRLERSSGHRFSTELVEAFPGEIDAISVSKPSLEDVFIKRTGHQFWTDPERRESTNSHH
jgi:ABC-2 type transport system ATP-binding protein